jgi:hypothetical protein
VIMIPAAGVTNSTTKGMPDIAGQNKRSQSFLAEQNGILKAVYLPAYKTGNPDADLQITIYRADTHGNPVGYALANKAFPAKAIGWSVKRLVIHPAVSLTKGKAYCIVLSSATKTAGYGFTYDNGGHYNPKNSFGTLHGGTLIPENGKKLNFRLIVTPIKSAGK